MARSAKPPDEGLAKRTVATGDGWSVHEVVCRAGPSDRPFEERHDGFSISAVVDGSFTYRSDVGYGLLYPGALLLGNNGRCFECGHAHGRGDRCVSLNVREDLFGEIAASAAATGRFRFPVASLPPTPGSLPIFAGLEALRSAASRRQGEELALRLIERVIGELTAGRRSPATPTARETRRVVEAIRLIERDPTRPLQLQDLAAIAGVSKYHFLRVFRRLVGMTPYQYLISARLRRAALDLASTKRPVLAVALDSGFGDLSTFNARFRSTFGTSPSKYRRTC
ncbi:MAG: helix-turn-helix transcriptional regulator [Hyphomicrobiales bacterium]|nr:helix-turn-helix transcriptional regulator [Hyphomicrobiales bacterium]MBV8443306.1 helix-turn-helix transcriptional regulator [Hyphomicrobiales bacterium]